MAPARFLPFTLLVLAAIVCAVVGESAPPVGYRFAHTRFVRRNFHQLPSDDQESAGVIPIRHRAPPPAFMHDKDLVRFVQCQYDPSVTDCDETKEQTDDEGPATNAVLTDFGSKEQSSLEVADGDEELADTPAIDTLIQADDGEDDDDYSSMLDDSIVEYINKHLDPTID